MKFTILILASFVFTMKLTAQEPMSLIVDVLKHNEWLQSIEINENKYLITIRGICSLTPTIEHCYSIITFDESGTQINYKSFDKFEIDFGSGDPLAYYKDTIFILNNDFYFNDPTYDWNIYLTDFKCDSLGLWQYSNQSDHTSIYSIIVDESFVFVNGLEVNQGQYGRQFVIKVDKSGNLILKDYLEGFTVQNSHNIPGDFIQTSDGNFVITNRYYYYNTQSSKSDYMVGLCKFDRDFNIIWSHYLPPRGWDFYNIDAHIAETHDEGLVLSTGLLTADSIFSNPEYYLQLGKWPVMMYKFDKDGNINWIDTLYTKTIENTHGSSRKKVNKLITARNGDVIGIGTYSHPLTKPYDWGWLFRYSPDGELLWEHYYEEKDNPGKTYFSDVIEDEKENIICVGEVTYINQPGNYNAHGWLLRVDSMGCYEPGCHTDSLSKVITPVEEISFASASRKILFFPNPANRDITVMIPDIWLDEKWRWEIYEINGRKIKDGALEKNIHSRISGLETLESGLYFIRFYSGSGVSVTEKLVVE